MVAAAKIAVEAKYQHGLYGGSVHTGCFRNVSCQLARRGIALAAKISDYSQFSLGGAYGHALGEHAHNRRILLGTSVASNDVIVQNGLNVPACRLRHFGEMAAAIQSLFFPGDGEEDDGSGKFKF